ncbi:MAG: DUF1905 domain-containing protein [Patescibacteria group bacterium]
MEIYHQEQTVGQLEKRKGGYYYLMIAKDVVDKYPSKRHTGFICTLEKSLRFQCGLNHLGDGNYFIIISKNNLELVNKKLGDKIYFELEEDPDPLGVPIPEVLKSLFEDQDLKNTFDSLTLGKKRHVIHTVSRIKDPEKQTQAAFRAIYSFIKSSS